MSVGKVLGIGLKSALEEAPEAIAKKQDKMPAHSMPNALARQGVKKEEKEFSGVYADQPAYDPTKKTSVAALQEQVLNRADEFATVIPDRPNYNSVTPNRYGIDNPTYREKVTTFSLGEPGSRYSSSHFPEVDNYLMHRRELDDRFDGVETRVLVEVQSDLHAAARAAGGYGSKDSGLAITPATVEFLRYARSSGVLRLNDAQRIFENVTGKSWESISTGERVVFQRWLEKIDIDQDTDQVMVALQQTADSFLGESKAIPDSPWKDSWVRKGIEQSILEAQEDGITQLAVPLSGFPELARGKGVQAGIYAKAVPQTLRRIAKRNGWQLRTVTRDTVIEVEDFPDFVNEIDATNIRQKFEEAEDFGWWLRDNDRPELHELGQEVTRAAYELINRTTKEPDPDKVSELFRLVDNARAIASDTRKKETYLMLDMGQKEVIQEGERSVEVMMPDQLLYASNRARELDSTVEGDWTDYINVLNEAEEGISAEMQWLADEYDSVARALGEEQRGEEIAQAALKRINEARIKVRETKSGEGVAELIEEIEGELNLLGTVPGRSREVRTPKPPKHDFKLYSSPMAGGFMVYSMLSMGMSEEEVVQKLKADGYERDDAKGWLRDAMNINKAYEQGLTRDQIVAAAEAREAKLGETNKQNPAPMPEDFAYSPLPSMEQQIDEDVESFNMNKTRQDAQYATSQLHRDEVLEATELLASLRVVHPDQTFLATNVAGLFGNEAASRAAEANAVASVNAIQKSMEAKGYPIIWSDDVGNWVLKDNPEVVVDNDMLRSIYEDVWAARGELGGAIGGAIAGGKLAARKTKNPWAIAGGVVLGGAIGSVAGTEYDYYREAMRHGLEMKADVAMRKAFNAAELSLVGDGAAWAVAQVFKASIRGGQRFIDLVRGGDLPSAQKALFSHSNVTEEEADEIVRQLSEIMTVPGRNQMEKRIAGVVMTQPGGEGILRAAVNVRPRAGQALVRSVNDRAQSLLKQVDELKNPQAAKTLVEDLNAYVHDTKMYFAEVKEVAARSSKSSNFSFDYDKLAIDPVLQSLKNGIESPQVRQRFLLQMRKVRQLGTTRTFTDLLELRRLVNDFKFNKRISSSKDFEALNDVIKGIDAEIERGAFEAVDEPQRWLQSWRDANKAYAEMKSVEKNALFKVMTRPGVSPKVIAQGLTKYITSIDGTFHEVMSKLPKSSRSRVEAEVLSTMVDKFTHGTSTGGFRAIDFPSLADELRKIPFTTKENRALASAVDQVGEVFKNDVMLSNARGPLNIPRFQSYLTTDPVVRAKFELASGIFNRVKQMVPGEQQQDLALVNTLAKLLDEPMDKDIVQEMYRLAGDNIDVQNQVAALQKEMAKQRASEAEASGVRVKLFGKGKILSLKPGKGASDAAESIAQGRIATAEQAQQIAVANGVNPADVKQMDELLEAHGFLAVQYGTDKVRRVTK